MKVSQSFTKFHKVMLFSLFLLASCQKDTKTPLSLAGTEASTELRTPCPGFSTEGCTVKNKSFTFYYEGCPIDVLVRVFYCPDGIYMDPPVWTMQIHPRCKALKQKLSDIYENYGESAVLDEWNNIVKFLVNSTRSSILNGVSSETGIPYSYPCTGIGTPCNPASYTITATQSDCIRMCANKVYDEDGNYIWELSSIVCGNSCCYKYTAFCILPDGTPCIGASTSYQVSPCVIPGISITCESPAISGNICSPGCDRL